MAGPAPSRSRRVSRARFDDFGGELRAETAPQRIARQERALIDLMGEQQYRDRPAALRRREMPRVHARITGKGAQTLKTHFKDAPRLSLADLKQGIGDQDLRLILERFVENRTIVKRAHRRRSVGRGAALCSKAHQGTRRRREARRRRAIAGFAPREDDARDLTVWAGAGALALPDPGRDVPRAGEASGGSGGGTQPTGGGSRRNERTASIRDLL